MTMKVEADPTTFFADTMRRMADDGLLLGTVDAEGKPNVMTVGWGTMGSIWGKPVLLVLVRPSRLSYRNIEATGEFTLNVPSVDMSSQVLYCGTHSGRDCNKFEGCGLTADPGEKVRAPIIRECAIHFECAVVHKNDVQPPCLAEDIRSSSYADREYHRIFWGEIVACRADIVEKDRVLGPLA